MKFDPDNAVVKLCVLGMKKEGEGKQEEARMAFTRAWNQAKNDFEKYTAAHYLARHQKNSHDKLMWDETALSHALKIDVENNREAYPSLFLNVGKCHEDLNNFEKALENYKQALFYIENLPQNGYGRLIKQGILNGIKRLS